VPHIRSLDYALQDIRALQETGIRARFSYGWMQGQANNQATNIADLEKLKNDWPRYSNDGLITLGFAWRGQGGNNPQTAVPLEVWKPEIEAAKKLNLPVTVHASGSRPAAGQIAGIDKAGLITKDFQFIHANFATDDEIKAVAAAGAAISSSPFTELRIGFGLPQTAKFLAAKVRLGLSVDTVELSATPTCSGS
jgi:5-methylthioadenosine/S-adenosylhomocysteine deaminase